MDQTVSVSPEKLYSLEINRIQWFYMVSKGGICEISNKKRPKMAFFYRVLFEMPIKDSKFGGWLFSSVALGDNMGI